MRDKKVSTSWHHIKVHLINKTLQQHFQDKQQNIIRQDVMTP